MNSIPRRIAVLGNGRHYKSFLRYLDNNSLSPRFPEFSKEIQPNTDFGFVFFDHPLNSSTKHLRELKPIPYLKFWPRINSGRLGLDYPYYFMDLDLNWDLNPNSDYNWPKILREILKQS